MHAIQSRYLGKVTGLAQRSRNVVLRPDFRNSTKRLSSFNRSIRIQASYLLNFYMGISRRVSALSNQFGNTQYNHRPFFRCHARALTGNTP